MKARAVLLVLALAGLARAEELVTARLDWQRAEGAEQCMDRDALERAVAERLARDPFTDQGSDVVVRGKVSPLPDAGGWRAELELSTTSGARLGTRTIRTEAAHCSALDESLPLVLALMLDMPEDEVRRAEQSQLPAAPAEPARKPAPTTPIALPRTVHAPRQPWRFRAAALASGALGLQPGPGLGAGLTLGVEPPSFWLTELDATLWLPSEADEDGEGARYRLISFAVYLCPITLQFAPLRTDLCAGQRVGRLDADGFGFDRNRERARLIYDVGARARAWLTLAGPVGVLFGVGAEIPLARDRFFFTGADGREHELFRASPVIGTADLGVGVSLP